MKKSTTTRDKNGIKIYPQAQSDETMTPSQSHVRKSPVTMTKYEHAKVIGIRAEQLARGSQPFVNDDEQDGQRFDPIAIAQRELDAGVLPFVVVRNLPDGSQEKWRLRDLVM